LISRLYLNDDIRYRAGEPAQPVRKYANIAYSDEAKTERERERERLLIETSTEAR